MRTATEIHADERLSERSRQEDQLPEDAHPVPQARTQTKESSSRLTRCMARVASVIEPDSDGKTAKTREI